MTEQDLLAHGWVHDPLRHVHQWRDPLNRLSWYTFRDACLVQQKRVTAQEEKKPRVQGEETA